MHIWIVVIFRTCIQTPVGSVESPGISVRTIQWRLKEQCTHHHRILVTLSIEDRNKTRQMSTFKWFSQNFWSLLRNYSDQIRHGGMGVFRRGSERKRPFIIRGQHFQNLWDPLWYPQTPRFDLELPNSAR